MDPNSDIFLLDSNIFGDKYGILMGTKLSWVEIGVSRQSADSIDLRPTLRIGKVRGWGGNQIKRD